MTYDNIKSHKKPRLYSFSRRHFFRKTIGEIKSTNCPSPLPPVNNVLKVYDEKNEQIKNANNI